MKILIFASQKLFNWVNFYKTCATFTLLYIYYTFSNKKIPIRHVDNFYPIKSEDGSSRFAGSSCVPTEGGVPQDVEQFDRVNPVQIALWVI
jgi:hypothetical protein